MSTILDYLTGIDDPEVLAKAVDSLVARQSARRLRAALADDLTCEACQTYLVDYAQAKDLAASLQSDLQAVERHLAHCQTCRADYYTLQALSGSAEAKELADKAAPTPDLTFLRTTVNAAFEPGLWRQVEGAHHLLLTALQIGFSQTAAWFSTWPDSLAPQLVPVPILRGGPESGASQRLVLPAAIDDLTFELTIMSSAGLAQIGFGVFQRVAHQPVSQVTVTLFNEQRQRLQRADTGADGLVTLVDLPSGSYYLQVRTKESQWEMAVVINETHST